MICMELILAFALQSSASDPFAGLRDQLALNLHNRLVEASVAECADDADFIDPSGGAIRQLFQNIPSTFDSDPVFTSQRVEKSGDLAYGAGTFRETLIARAIGKRQESTGSYLTVYRRSKEGGWLIVEQVWAGPPIEMDAK